MIPDRGPTTRTWSRRRAFYQYQPDHGTVDGPAAIAFTDGKQIGAILDRNGLRPSAFCVTKDARLMLETGVLDIPPQDIVRKGPAFARRIFLVDTEQGSSSRTRRSSSSSTPSARNAASGSTSTSSTSRTSDRPEVHAAEHPTRWLQRQVAFGYTYEDERVHPRPDGPRRVRGDRLDGQRRRTAGSPTNRACSTICYQAGSSRKDHSIPAIRYWHARR